MAFLNVFIASLAAVAAVAWLALAFHLVAVERRRAAAKATVARVHAILNRVDVRARPLEDREALLAAELSDASRDLLMREAASPDTPDALADVLCACIVNRWGLPLLERDAAMHRSARTKWRRTTALRILWRLRHPRILELLALAAEQPDADVAASAFALLGRMDDRRAADVLLDALTRREHPASRVAVHLDRSPLDLSNQLLPLLQHRDGTVRFWAAVLLGRYAGQARLEIALAAAADDGDPRVRKAAVESLSRIGDRLAADVAVKLLGDPISFVRANAARALGRMERSDEASGVARLLADRDWWVRFAAKQALEAMGAEVWPVVYPYLTHTDRFARNSAAEVFQNLGLLDSLIVLEAASDDPAPQKIEILRRIAAAGGVRLTDALIARAGPVVGLRVRHLLTMIGLQDVGAA
jgi:HEAT repeat protein